MQNEGKPWHFCVGVPDHTSPKPVGLIGRDVPSLSKPNTWSQMTWSFYLRSNVLILKNNPSGEWKSLLSFRLVKFLRVWFVLVGCSRGWVFFSWCLPAGGISLLCCIRDDVLNYCTCEFQEMRQQPSLLSQTARHCAPQQFLSMLGRVIFTGATQPWFHRQLYAAN